MSNTKKSSSGRIVIGINGKHIEHSYKPNEGGLKPNPPKKPSSQPNPPKK